MRRRRKPKPAPDALAPDEISLACEAETATEENLARLQARLEQIASAWALPFDQDALRLVRTDHVTAIFFRWPAHWREMPASSAAVHMWAIEARVALSALVELPGWRLLPGEEQDRLRALLGGATNLLSEQQRRGLAKTYRRIENLDEAAQAKTLREAIGTKETLPRLVEDRIVTHPVDYKVSAATTVPRHSFRGSGQSMDAERYSVEFADRSSMIIRDPQTIVEGRRGHTVDQMAEAASHLEKNERARINTIELNPDRNERDAFWAQRSKKREFTSYMTAGAAGVVGVYPLTHSLPDREGAHSALVHENGHIWSKRAWGEDETQGGWLRWREAMKQDGLSVSSYATDAIVEDVAETVRAYACQGTPAFDEYRKMVPHRFAILDKEYVR